MALNQIIDLSTTAGNNLDFIGVGIPEGMFPDKVNDAMRALGKILADAVPRHVAKGAGTYTPAKTDHNQFWRCTGAVTLNLTAAATLTDGWALWVRANGGAVTIDPNGAETIDGATTLILADGQTALILCTGTTFFSAMANGYLVSNDAGATVGPTLSLLRDSASPAASDIIGRLLLQGRDSAANIQDYAEIDGQIDDATSTSEDAMLRLRAAVAGTMTNLLTLNATSAVLARLLDISGAAASQIKFGNANNSADTATLDGYTDWIAYTPTFTGFGTVSAVSIWSKRIGDTLHIRGKFTSGVSTAVEARMTLGFNGTNANVNSDATKVASIQLAGEIAPSFLTTNTYKTLIESNVGYITFSLQNAASGSLTKINGSTQASNGDTLSLKAEIPISGW